MAGEIASSTDSVESSDVSTETDGVRLAHISDLHFGRITDPYIKEALVSDLRAFEPEIVVVSGDLTQRAFPWQYRDAREFLDNLDLPWIAVPGNHDVYPWWRPVLRLADPLRRYRHWISPDTHAEYVSGELSILGINTAFGKTVKGGRILETDRDRMRSFFSESNPATFRILVVHHHITRLDAILVHDLARGSRKTLRCAAELGVDMILCGHLHVSHIAHVEHVATGGDILVATAGTATSDRGRGVIKARNFYNQIIISDRAVTLDERAYRKKTRCFESSANVAFPRFRSVT